MPPTPLAAALEEAARRQPPKPSTPLANALMEYASRVQGDFQHGLDQSAQGFGEMVNGHLATGIPRTFLGGLGWLGSPVSGALSPILNPVMTPIAQGVHDYVGQPIENATGYPADLTTELALAAALPKALHGAGKVTNAAIPYLARIGDEVGARVGVPAGSYMSGPGPTKPRGLADLLNDADPAELQALKARLEAEASQTGGTATSATRQDALGKLVNDGVAPEMTIFDRMDRVHNARPMAGAEQPSGPVSAESAANLSELERTMAEFEANRGSLKNAPQVERQNLPDLTPEELANMSPLDRMFRFNSPMVEKQAAPAPRRMTAAERKDAEMKAMIDQLDAQAGLPPRDWSVNGGADPITPSVGVPKGTEGGSVGMVGSEAPMIAYHGSPKTFEDFNPRMSKHRGVTFFSTNEQTAKHFTRGSENGSVGKFQIDGKLFDPTNNEHLTTLNNAIDKNFKSWFSGALFGPESAKSFAASGDWGVFERPEVMKFLKSNGFDGWRFQEGIKEGPNNSIALFNTKKAKRIN